MSKTTVTDANGRALVVESIDVGDLFDLLEAAGAAGTNPGWMQLAMTVASVRQIGEVPVVMPTTKDAVRHLGRTLGNAGLAAVRSVLFPDVPEQETEEDIAAKN